MLTSIITLLASWGVPQRLVKPLAYLGSALLMALLVGLLWARGNHYRHKAESWQSAFKAQKAAYTAAQAEAEAKQRAADVGNLAAQIEHNKQMDIAHDRLEAARSTAVGEYIRTHRLRPEAAGCSPGGTGAAGVPGDPGPLGGGRADSDFVAVKPEDIDAWSKVEVQNTERGDLIRWAIEQGYAIPASELPKPEFGK